jgi:hypothetical protein
LESQNPHHTRPHAVEFPIRQLPDPNYLRMTTRELQAKITPRIRVFNLFE